MTFDGKTFDAELDESRLKAQLERVKRVMGDGQWRTLDEIAEATKDHLQSISARLRDLRKPKFGGWLVDRRRRKGLEEKGVFEYRVVLPDTPEGNRIRALAPLTYDEGRAALIALSHIALKMRERGETEPAAIKRLGQFLKMRYPKRKTKGKPETPPPAGGET